MKKSNGEGSITVTERQGKKYYTGRITLYNIDGKPQRKSKSFYKKSIVIKWMQENQIKSYTEDSLRPIGEYIEEYLYQVKKPTVKDATFVRYETLYRHYIENTPLSEMPIANITPEMLQEYFSKLQKEKSASITNRVLDIYKMTFKKLQQQGSIRINPTLSVEVKKHIKEKREAFTSEEQKLIMKNLDITDTTDRLILLDFVSGLRLSELLALTNKDVKNGQISVNKQYARCDYIDKNKKRVTHEELTTPKTKASIRTVPIPEPIYKKIKPYIKQGLLFTENGKDPIDRKKPQRRIKTICEKLDIPYKPFHSIRHSYCTRLFESGVSPKAAQILMGHTDISTTMNIYTHVTENIKEDSVKLFEKNFFTD